MKKKNPFADNMPVNPMLKAKAGMKVPKMKKGKKVKLP